MSPKAVQVLWAGRLGYGAGLRLQKSLVSRHFQKRGSEVTNTLVLLEHEPVYTVGLRSKGYTPDDEEKLRRLGAEFFRTDRGGLITFHGPGQLVAYPVLDLKDFRASVKWFVCQIERTVIRLCAEFGIRGETSPDTGVWVDDRKICAIGVHGSRFVTSHGLALNCNTDLSWFDHIVPCGIEGKGVTSISRELQADVGVQEVLPVLKNAFEDQFDCRLTDFPGGEASELLRSASAIERA